MNPDVNLTKLNDLVNKTIITIDTSKNELHNVSNEFKIICSKLQSNYLSVKNQVAFVAQEILELENKISEFQNFNKTLENVSNREGYETAIGLRNLLIIKRNEEHVLLRKRNSLELQLKETLSNLTKADTASENITMSLDILNDDLQRMSKEIEDIQTGQNIGIKIIKAQEEERQRVALEMHDGPAQVLANVLIRAEVCDKLMDIEPDNAFTEISKLKSTISECLTDIKKIVYDLRPSSLDELGLNETLKRHIDSFSSETGIVTEFKIYSNVENIDKYIDSNVSLTLFRIIQESMNNIKKHSGASYSKISLSFSQNFIELLVYDNGKGFDINSLLQGTFRLERGFGLIGLKERVKLLDGEVDIQSFPGEGVTLKITIPYDLNGAYNTGNNYI